MPYTLPSDVYLANVEGDVVLLDAFRDRYASIPASLAGTLRAGISAGTWSGSPLEDQLAAEGYLTASTATIPGIRPAAPISQTRDLYSLTDERPVPTQRDVRDAAVAGIVAAFRLKAQRPSNWLNRQPHGASDLAACILNARRFAEARLYLPLLTRCLPHSLALVHFLERRNCTAQLIFGVRTHPFEAHCWVQKDDIVLNDTLDHTLWYTPIAWT